MKAIIMAAGVGKRLYALNINKPKCLLTASGGETLIRRSVNLLISKGISDITVIVGFQAHLIRNELNNDVFYFNSPDFKSFIIYFTLIITIIVPKNIMCVIFI